MGFVLDTSGLYALIDRREPAHERCNAAALGFQELIVPALALVELDYWCRKRGGGPRAFEAFAAELAAGHYVLADITETDLGRAAQLGSTYADLDLGVVDASIVALCERLGEDTVLTLDRRHFSVVRPRHCAALRLLPE